jgi:hypothetical protein
MSLATGAAALKAGLLPPGMSHPRTSLRWKPHVFESFPTKPPTQGAPFYAPRLSACRVGNHSSLPLIFKEALIKPSLISGHDF